MHRFASGLTRRISAFQNTPKRRKAFSSPRSARGLPVSALLEEQGRPSGEVDFVQRCMPNAEIDRTVPKS